MSLHLRLALELLALPVSFLTQLAIDLGFLCLEQVVLSLGLLLAFQLGRCMQVKQLVLDLLSFPLILRLNF